jgi:sodium/potassium-transporting ATPase subunit alpha
MVGGEVLPLDEAVLGQVQSTANELASMGERILAMAMLSLDEVPPQQQPFHEVSEGKYNFPVEGLCLVGLVSLIDPPREGVREAVAKCKDAGIKVIMVTGDHPLTAKAIAKEVGIITKDTVEDIAQRKGVPVSEVNPAEASAIVLHGGDIKALPESEWDRILSYEEIVFARTSPQQKLVIVEHNQRIGEVVAVTGDGVNDSPALKRADIGIAMGIAGSDVSKEAADMVLLDDNFASLVKGVEEGRLIFDNLKKSIAYTLSSNIPEIFPFIFFATLQIPLALTTILILCIDLGTDMLPAISLAYEKAENDIMKIPPRNQKTARLVTKRLISFSYLQIGMIQAMAGFFCFFWVLNDFGFSPKDLLFSAKTWSNPDPLSSSASSFSDQFGGHGYSYRMNALGHAQSAYFVSIVITQVADVLICKTRRISLFEGGWKLPRLYCNKMLLIGLVEELLLTVFILYVPGVNTVLGTKPIAFKHWLLPLPFAVVILIYDEIRKLIQRKKNKCGSCVSFVTKW